MPYRRKLMNFNDFDYGHLAKVAFAGAVTAVVADIIHSQLGGEFSEILTQLQGFITNVVTNNPAQPAAV
jgi:hypothetical protein